MAHEEKRGQSIHPRVVNGRTMLKKVNTCANPGNPPGKCLRKTLRKLEWRRHARDISVESLSKNSAIDWQKAYRRPGSMKP